MGKIIKKILFYSLFIWGLTGCHDAPEYKNTLYGNFDALVEIIDTHYCFLSDKNIDWAEVSAKYREELNPEITLLEFYNICAEMLDELQDGHVNLISRFSTSYYRNWWSDYPQDFNMRTLEEYYLDFDWYTTSGIIYKQLPGEIAYMYYSSFASTISESALDYIFQIIGKSRGLIIDIRDNGGGSLTNINTLIGRFIDEPIIGGYIMHKTGPGHDDFSEPYPMKYEPADSWHLKWDGEIVVLTNRSCFSAANNFVSVIKDLPNVTVIGGKTGGGGGMPFTSEIPIGWSVRFSACPILDAKGNLIEDGINPTPGWEVHASEEELAQGKDAILDAAIEKLKNNPLPDEEES